MLRKHAPQSSHPQLADVWTVPSWADVERGAWPQNGFAAAQAAREARTRGSAEDTRMVVGSSSSDPELLLIAGAE
jgi:hypothetical protein